VTHLVFSCRQAIRHGWCCALFAVATIGCATFSQRGPVPESVKRCRQLSREGLDASQRGDAPSAERLLNAAVEQCPVDVDARRHYSEVLWDRGARTAAIEQIEAARRLAPRDTLLAVRGGQMLMDAGDHRAAYARASEVLDIDPGLPSAWLLRGRAAAALGDSVQALGDYHKALGLLPNDRETMYEIAELYRQRGKPQRALAALQGLADTFPPGEEPSRLFYLKGLALTALHRYDDAVDQYTAANRIQQPSAEVFARIAEAEYLSGRSQLATAAVQAALELDPAHTLAQRLSKDIRVAQQTQSQSARQ
jgi:tetratricopeptide (TPR) repeat protein